MEIFPNTRKLSFSLFSFKEQMIIHCQSFSSHIQNIIILHSHNHIYVDDARPQKMFPYVSRYVRTGYIEKLPSFQHHVQTHPTAYHSHSLHLLAKKKAYKGALPSGSEQEWERRGILVLGLYVSLGLGT